MIEDPSRIRTVRTRSHCTHSRYTFYEGRTCS